MELEKLEEKLGYVFTNKELLHEAVRHSSYVNEQAITDLGDNERMEFLGDAVLNLVVGHILMKRYPELAEGDLSRMRAALVNEYQLASIAKTVKLGKFILLSKGEIQTNGRKKKSILADAFEAVIAAVYLDGGFEAAFQFVKNHFAQLFDSDAINANNNDYKSKLQEIVQMTHKTMPTYEVVEESGPDHDKTFVVQIRIKDIRTQGVGKSKKLRNRMLQEMRLNYTILTADRRRMTHERKTFHHSRIHSPRRLSPPMRFCSQTVITGKTARIPNSSDLIPYIDDYLQYNRRKTAEIAFYGGNFLGLAPESIRSLLDAAQTYVHKGAVSSIRFSTRPDTVDENRLNLIDSYDIRSIELGVQSMNDRVLEMSLRGHTAADVESAVRLLKERGYDIGVQIMTGLPGDDGDLSVETVKTLCRLGPNFARIYPTVVLKNTLLAKWYREGAYTPMPLDRCVALVKKMYCLFIDNGIKVIRMGLQAAEDLEKDDAIVAGPYHPAFGHMVYSAVFLDRISCAIEAEKLQAEKVSIRVHPSNISKARGLKNRNIEILKARHGFLSVAIFPDDSLTGDKVVALID